jgi:hypothetical protein
MGATLTIFIVQKPEVARFVGDFQISRAENSADPSPEEQGYVDAVTAALGKLAKQEADDVETGYPEELLESRRSSRGATAHALLQDVHDFLDGNNPKGDQTVVNQTMINQEANVPRFCATADPKITFEKAFEIVPVRNYVPQNQDEQAFVDAVRAALKELADDRASDRSPDAPPGLSQTVLIERSKLRDMLGQWLFQQVNGLWTSKLPVKAIVEQVLLKRGKYEERRERLSRRLFNVTLPPLDDRKRQDISISLVSGLPTPNDKPSDAKLALYIQINKTMTVIRAVCDRIGEHSDVLVANVQSGKSRWDWIKPFRLKPSEVLDSDALYKDFIIKLHGIAVVGLEREFTELAQASLVELRNEFFVRAAARIKNIHVNKLASTALVASAATVGTYAVIKLLFLLDLSWWTKGNWADEHCNFLLAACGAAIGTWASFAVRQMQFSFDDLVMVEESALKPYMRAFFVVTLTMAACMLFWNGAVNIEIGALKTQAPTFKTSGTIALLIGLFCGLSERALATAIAGRAVAFVKSVGGN